ncbi:hypothetical protein Ctob_013849 [Chrysochromulina tobinii]|uniref:Uncharacterized protein n=1 Tax=Chrysochromulina tobinii TaxID=1460289 RepID=A0A0M0JYC2_9EUKA|nr:hypothetical protein Ctob_013849 [Chrysochromulina tobinii]|eukprot:KOO31564.1 hypothetical protein Ctob_013849 [Chrysochromulina sp. CCMP291]
MNVPIDNSIGLRVYRELMAKEAKGPAVWAMTYGIEALQKPPDPQMLLNLGKFSKYSSMHMPLEVQLQAIRKERNVQTAAVDHYEKRIYPQRSTIPVSELSIKYYGEKAFHSQPKGPGAPCTYKAWEGRHDEWTKRRWDVDHIQWTTEGLGPAHVNARKAAGHGH